MRDVSPGMVCDLYVLRRRYDDEQHMIRRQQDDHDISADDAAAFERMEKGEEVNGFGA